MKEENMEFAHDLDELAIDILKRFVVFLQGVDQAVVGVDNLLRHHRATDPFEAAAPFGKVRTFVWCAEKQDTIPVRLSVASIPSITSL